MVEAEAARREAERAAAALRRSECRYRTLVDATGAVTWSCPPSGLQLEPQSSSMAFTDQTLEEMFGTGWSQAIHPDHVTDFARRWAEAVEQGVNFFGETRIRRHDGEWRWMSVHAAPVRDANGRIAEWVGMNLDITERKAAEHALQTSEARLRLGLDVAGLALAEVDYRTGLFHLSAEAAKLFGLGDTARVLPRAVVHATFHAEDASTLKAFIAASLDPDGPGWFEMDHRIVWPDGQVRWLRVRKQVFFEGSGVARQPHKAMLAAMDVTAEKSAAEVQLRSQEFVRNVLDSLPALVVVLDRDGTVIAANEPWERLARDSGGESSRMSVGANYLDVCRRASLAGDDGAEAALNALESVRSGQSPEGAIEYPCQTPQSLLWFIMRVCRLHDDAGLVVSHIDITERKQAEAELERTRSLLAEGQRIAHLGSFEYIAATGETIWSDEEFRIYGLEPGAISPSYADLMARHFHPDDAAALDRNFGEALRTGGVFENENRIVRPDGSVRWIHNLARPSFDARGKLLKYIGATLDITERKRIEEALREADRRKDEFLAMLAHELRNPLAPMRNGLHILRRSGDVPPTTERLYAMMERQVEHLVRLVDDLLEVSRITQGKIELQRERTDLAAIIGHAVETSLPLIRAAGHDLNISQPPVGSLVVEGDPVRLAQVLSNLLNNASKFMERGGHIRVAVERREGDAVVSVQDEGIGLAAEMLPRVFDLFTQVDCSIGRAQGGLGIGLALARRMVELHGGRVEARSGGLGRGSEFVVHLPLAITHPADAPVRPVATQASRPPRRILVVDDNRDAADSLGLLLESADADVRVVYDGPSALEALSGFRPEAVLLDLGMPGMDGYETARLIRQRPEGRHIALIALTGWGQDQDRARTRRTGFDHHLVKPVDFDLLQALLASLDTGPEAMAGR
jgi:PAS domain S-box-containing protein